MAEQFDWLSLLENGSIHLSGEQIGEAYPFQIDGDLKVFLRRREERLVPYVTLATTQGEYAINGMARESGKYRDYQEIWKDNPKKPTSKMPMSGIMSLAMEMLRIKYPLVYEQFQPQA